MGIVDKAKQAAIAATVTKALDYHETVSYTHLTLPTTPYV